MSALSLARRAHDPARRSRWTTCRAVGEGQAQYNRGRDLDRIIITHSLPADTKARIKRSLRTLERFPRIGRELDGRWHPMRFILGPWRWMLVIYDYDEANHLVIVLTIQDARSSTAATN